jgi:heme oxygenase
MARPEGPASLLRRLWRLLLDLHVLGHQIALQASDICDANLEAAAGDFQALAFRQEGHTLEHRLYCRVGGTRLQCDRDLQAT